MKLEIGMYCFNKTNRKLGIGKIINFQNNNNVNIKYKNDIELVSVGNIVASHNIIDLIEEGDLVKFKKYGELFIYEVYNKSLVNFDGDVLDLEELEIVSIVTKEQFESMSYKL